MERDGKCWAWKRKEDKEGEGEEKQEMEQGTSSLLSQVVLIDSVIVLVIYVV